MNIAALCGFGRWVWGKGRAGLCALVLLGGGAIGADGAGGPTAAEPGPLMIGVTSLRADSADAAAAGSSALYGTGTIALFYPTRSPTQAVQRGPFVLQVALEGAPVAGNGRLVVLSHGSGGGPWVHSDLAAALVRAGFVVAVPWHRGDNSLDPGRPGPTSWAQRPREMSAAIDQVAADTRFAPLLRLDKVGAWGQSAGGHTVLSLAGGAWSPKRFSDHCQAHVEDDFNACVGLFTELQGNWLDGLKLWAARRVLGFSFTDATPHTHTDPRFAALVAGVPAAADFDTASLARPRVPLALVTAAQDAWLTPRFHSDRVLAACLPRCEVLAAFAEGGHNVMLSPLPPGLKGLEARLLADPPGFDRTALVALHMRTVRFFERHLLETPGPKPAALATQ